jgi:transcriptional regulator of arginine metabolism
MNNERQECILKLISQEPISTQEQLAKRLTDEGFLVTQATISRDIRALGIKKEPREHGPACFAKPQNHGEIPDHFVRVLKEGFVRADVAMNILVIKTVSGMAMAVAAALDAYQFPELVGCIAGDDTVMCAIRDTASAKKLKKNIEALLNA